MKCEFLVQKSWHEAAKFLKLETFAAEAVQASVRGSSE